MELILNELPVERIIGCATAQTLVEGEIPLPGERTATQMLDADGQVSVERCEIGDGIVTATGEILLQLLCAAEDDVFAFRSAASFRHTIRVEGAKPGEQMCAQVFPALQTLDVTLESGALKLSAVVDLCCRVTADGIQAPGSIRGDEQLEIKTMPLCASRRETVLEDILMVREELSAPDAARVVCARVTAQAAKVSCAGGQAALSGTLTVSALTASRSGRLSQLVRSIPLEETLDAPDAEYGVLRVRSAQVRAVGEEFGILAVEAELSVQLYRREAQNAALPLDAFVPGQQLGCAHESAELCCYLGETATRHSISETINIPAGMPEAEQTIYAAARPAVTAYSIQGGTLCTEGLLFTRVLYQSGGRLYSFCEDIPFSCSVPAPDATDALIDACCCVSVTGSGRAVEAQFSLMLSAALYARNTVQLMQSMQACERSEPPHGILVYYCGAGETLYDVAKRFDVPRAKLRRLAPELGEELAEGQRTLLVR